jgi:hypothetical protein
MTRRSRYRHDALGGACQVEGGDPASGRLDVRFAVRELRVQVADQYGLLLPDQVERIALHELGHALGMRAHSPIPADLMYPVVRDRLPRGELGAEDVNSFLSLYSLPNGTVYRRADIRRAELALLIRLVEPRSRRRRLGFDPSPAHTGLTRLRPWPSTHHLGSRGVAQVTARGRWHRRSRRYRGHLGVAASSRRAPARSPAVLPGAASSPRTAPRRGSR